MADQIPTERPVTPLLDSIDDPGQLRQLKVNQLPLLAKELRQYLLFAVGKTGGHFGAGLGVVELTIALHYVFNTPTDPLVWDVGHQCYPHKILTGRREDLLTIRQQGGLAPFPQRGESPYDSFGVGHSSTSISSGLGMSIAARLAGEQRQVVSIIGDGAMTAGIAFEALNHAAETKADLLVVLNDNDMSISDNVGGLSRYLTRMLSSRPYLTVRAGGEKFLAKLPRALDLARRAEEHVKGMVMPGTLFEELGFTYFGPLDGHDLAGLVRVLAKLKQLGGPRLVHVLTQKGKGFAQAEADPIGYHALAKIQPLTEQQQASDNNKIKHLKPLKYCQVFGRWLCDMAEQEPKLVGITPAMKEGSDLIEFAQRFPQRYFDVAIAEQHSVTLAAGLACGGLKPVVAIYSTFLQRGYDQLIHDVAIQNLDVLFAIDRAGLVGEDGETHMGAFDISYLRCIPNLVLMTPADENQTRQMLYTGFCYPGPAAVRYPRGTGPGVEVQSTMDQLPLGKGVLKRTGQRVALLVFGTLFKVAEQVADSLDSSLADMRFVKPLDTELIDYLAAHHQLLVTLEENVIAGGAGSAVNEYLLQSNHSVAVLNLGLPDRFIIHGSPAQQQQHCGLDKAGISAAIQAKLA